MAGNGAAANIEGFIFFFMNAFSKAAITFTATNIGARQGNRLRRIAFYCIGCAFVFGFVSGWSAYLLQDVLLRIYIPSDLEALKYASLRMGIIAVSYCICGIMDVLAGLIVGMGNSFIPMLVSLVGICGFRILWIFTYFEAHKTVDVVYYSWPLSWIVAIAVYIPVFIYMRRKTYKRLQE